MVWNASKPADSDRIRLSAGLLRENFQAIEDGTVPYTTLSLEQQASFPALAGHNRLYSYLNADSGKIELKSVNNTGQAVNITEGAYLGTRNTLGRFSAIQTGNISFDGVFVYAGGNMVISRGTVAAAGGLSMSINIASATKTGTGQYDIVIPAGVLEVNSYQVNTQVLFFNTPVAGIVVSKGVVNPALSTLIQVETRFQTSNTRVDATFDIIIVGGRN